MPKKMNVLDWVAISLVVVGALVHGGQAFGYYAVERILPMWSARIVYGAVGVAGLYSLWSLVKLAKRK